MTVVEVLSRLLLSLDEIEELLADIRKKYDIPDVLPGDPLVEALKSNEFYDWKAIHQEIETELRILFQPEKLRLDQWVQFFTDIVNGSPEIKMILMSQGIDVSEPVADRFVELVKKEALSALGGVNQFYVKGSEKLLEHLRTGSAIELPAEWFNFILKVTLPPDDKLVIAVAHEFNDANEIAEEFRKRVIETFPPKLRLTEKDKETAEYFSWKARGRTLDEITDVDVARHPDVITVPIGDPEYDEQFRNHKATINRRILRFEVDLRQLAGGDKT